MGDALLGMDRTKIDILGEDLGVEDFLKEWESDTEYIVAHTSGSTGTPKKILLPKKDMIASAKATCAFFGIDSSSRLVLPLNIGYIAGKMMVVRSIVSGAHLTVVYPKRDLSSIVDIDTPIDLLPIVPSQIPGLAHIDHSRIRNVIVGGAAITPDQESLLKALNINAYATYGMTETCSHVALRRIGQEDAFSAMPNITFDTDSDGCLIILAPKYTNRRIVTNDIVELIDSRLFKWVGRRDNVINSGGIKIIPEDVERLLQAFIPDIEFYVTARHSDIWGQELVIVIDGRASIDAVEAGLYRARESVPHHMLPKDVVTLLAHKYTSSGKLIRQRID